MGFLGVTQQASPLAQKGVRIELLHKLECQICPLNNVPNRNPHMTPAGAKKPLIYMLGEAPGENEDKRGVPFVGAAGAVLRFRIPDEFDDVLRWSNCVRTRPPKNRTPTEVEIECCRPSVERDIVASKPEAIFGFGNVPLEWALKQTGITKWCGRRIPVNIAGHKCWFFPIMHPSFILHTRKFIPKSPKEYGSDIELQFALDLKRAFAAVDAGLPEPVIHTSDDVVSDIDFVMGVNGETDVKRIIREIENLYDKKVVGFDYETKGLRPYALTSKILTIALASNDGSFAFPLHHPQAQWTKKELVRIEDAFSRFLYEAPCRKVVHNLAFEQEWTGYFYGVDALRAQPWACSQSQAFILDERPGTHSLDFLGMQHFGISIKDESHLDKNNLDSEPLDEVLRYNAIDAKYHRALYLKQVPLLQEEGLLPVYRNHLRRIPAVVITQLKGVPVNRKVSETFAKEYETRLGKIEANLAKLKSIQEFKAKNGHAFRPSAPKDVGTFLASIGVVHEGSTDESVLGKVDHPVARLVLKYRENYKLLGTYVAPLLPSEIAHDKQAHPILSKMKDLGKAVHPDGLLHPILSTMRTRTWRTSSEDPNSQNFPKREHKEIRRQIEALPGYKIVSIDYAQIQARNVAMESKDAALVKAFWDRYDIHTDWTERLVELYPKWVDEGAKKLAQDKALFKSYRDRTKNEFVFPSFFGAQPKTVSGYLNIPEMIGTRMQEEFWDWFGGIKGWHKRIQKDYRKTGYVTGCSGFRRHAPISPNQLINAPIQADEAIIVLDAMARLSEHDPDRFQPIMEIHDDLTFHMPVKDIEKNLEVIIPMMINTPFKWAHIVPIGVEVSIGDNWADKEEIGSYFSDQYNGLNLKPGVL